MKKLFTILGLLCLTLTTQAQEVTTWDTAGDLVSFEDFVASAGTDKRYIFRMPSTSRRGWCDFTTQAAVEANKPTINNLFSIETSPNDETAVVLKRFSDGLYLQGTSNASTWVEKAEATDIYLVNRTPSFTDPEEQYPVDEMADYYISMDDIDGNHFNNGNFGFRAGTGGWCAYYAYGPIYMVKVNCLNEYGEEVAPAAQFFGLNGATFTITPPEVLGYTTDETEQTVTLSEADQEITIYYKEAAEITYTINVIGAPEGTRMSIFRDEVDINATEYVAAGIVRPDDVEIYLPDEYDYMGYKVTVVGSVITVKIFDNRYAVNFDKEQTYTHTAGGGRKTTWVALGEQKIEWEFGGVGVEPVYRDMTEQVLSVPAGATVTPAIGFEGAWMHGFLYVDLNNDGAFSVDNPELQSAWSTEPNGELVSYKNQGNVLTSSSRELPDYTAPTEPGTYRVRFKVDWQSTDPGGNTGADPEDVNSANHIVANGGCIIDVTMVVGDGHTVTYQVLEEGTGKVLAEKTSEVSAGVTISSVPADLLLPDFYDYSEVTPVTVNSDVTITTTATLKEEPLFQFTSDTADPVWYTLVLKNSYYPTYDDSGFEPNVTLPQENAENDNTSWAFIGSPYEGFQIVNKAAGTNLVLSAPNIFDEYGSDDTAAGGNTYAEVKEPGTNPNELWFPKASRHATGGFFLYSQEGYALNQRSTYDLAFWSGGADAGSTFTVKKVLSTDEKLAEAEHLLEELTAGANDVKIGYPTEDALAQFKAKLDELKGQTGSSDFSTMLKAAIDEVKSIANTVYTPRTDVYYTITNPRGSVVYDPEHAEDLDVNGNEFLWYTGELDKENVNHQWGFYEKDGKYYLYNVGKKQFASVTTVDPAVEGKSFFSGGCWMFANKPAAVTLDAGDEEWVATPATRILGAVSVEDEDGNSYEDAFTMSISQSYTGPVITYYAENDGGVPMTFALATSTQDEEVTAAIEELLDPNGVVLFDAEKSKQNGAIYNLQGQRVNKAQKGVFIQNGKKIVVK